MDFLDDFLLEGEDGIALDDIDLQCMDKLLNDDNEEVDFKAEAKKEKNRKRKQAQRKRQKA